jgi:hypothetical protein
MRQQEVITKSNLAEVSSLMTDITKVIDELVLKENNWFKMQDIRYSVDKLLKHRLTEQQTLQLQVQLYRALENFNVYCPNRLYVQEEILHYCVRFNIAIPPQFAGLLKPWDKVALLWRGKNITWLELYPSPYPQVKKMLDYSYLPRFHMNWATSELGA